MYYIKTLSLAEIKALHLSCYSLMTTHKPIAKKTYKYRHNIHCSYKNPVRMHTHFSHQSSNTLKHLHVDTCTYISCRYIQCITKTNSALCLHVTAYMLLLTCYCLHVTAYMLLLTCYCLHVTAYRHVLHAHVQFAHCTLQPVQNTCNTT